MKCTLHTIRKGKHRTDSPKIKLHFGACELKYRVTFDSSCEYQTEDPKNQADINKLFGLSYGLHHKNSARFGWRSVGDGKIELLGYVYRNGKRINEWGKKKISIGVIDTNKEYVLELLVTSGYYAFVLKTGDQKEILNAVMIKYGKLFSIGYYLNPYFGGDEVSPHDMKIKMCKL